MAKNKEIVESLDEIVFAGRNKEYGAYQMRQLYPRYVNRAATVSIIAMLLAVTLPLIASYYNESRGVREEKTVSVEIADMNKPKEEAPPPEAPPPPEEQIEQKVKFVAPIVTEDTVAATGDVLNQDDLKTTVTNLDVTTEELVVEEKVEEKVIDEEERAPVFTVVEEMPSFPGGEEARKKFLVDNLVYPQLAKESGIQGTVYVLLRVSSKGKVTNVTIQRGIGGGCDEEAVRVVKMMPDWNPGKQAGKAVKVDFTMPIVFKLN